MGKDRGIALPITLVVMSALVGLAGAGLILSRSDLMISNNVVTGAKAIWTAMAGAEIGKNWLKANLTSGPFPTTLGPTTYVSGNYTVTIDRYNSGTNDGKFRITSTGVGPDNSHRVVEEVVRIPDLVNIVGAVTIDGDETGSQLNTNYLSDMVIPLSKEIPSFSIDGRNHDKDGNLSNTCADISPIAGTTNNLNTDVTGRVDSLKDNIVKESFNCNETGTDCPPGLFWVRGSLPGANYRYIRSGTDCPGCGCPTNPLLPQCYQNLDLSAPELWATAVTDNLVNPPAVTIPVAPNDRGPFMYDTPANVTDPNLVKVLTSTEVTQLQKAINDILDFAINAQASEKVCIVGDISGGTQTIGTWTDPKIAIVSDPNSNNLRMKALSTAAPCSGAGGSGNDLDVKDGAVVDGAGILIVPKRLRIEDATFNWQGIVVVLDDGDLRVTDSDACGTIIGAVILQDLQGNDPKLDLDTVEQQGNGGVCAVRPPLGCNPYTNQCTPFSINYSCEAVDNALGNLILQTISWSEKYGV